MSSRSSMRLVSAPSRGVAFASSVALVVGVLSGMQGLASPAASAEEDEPVATSPVELVDQRTETSTTFENPDGTRTIEMSGSPIRVVDEDAVDGWSDVDYNLEAKDDGTIAPIVSAVDLWISGGDTKEAARLTNDDGTFVAVTWPETLPKPSLDGGTATFAVSDTTSLVIIVTGAGFNAHIVLEEEPEAGKETFTLGLKTKDIDVSEANSHLAITDSSGETVVESQSMIAWDSQVDDAGDPLLPVTLAAELDEGTKVGGTVRQDLELTTPAGYLSDPDTEYPVVIDPSVTSLTQTRDTYVVNGTTTSNGTSGVLRVGSNDGDHAAESYLQFNLAPITSDMTVLDVDMQLWQYFAPSCGTYPVAIAALIGEWDSNQTWATRPNASSTGAFWWSFANKGPSACANGWQSMDLTTMTNSWLDGTRVNRGIRISIPAAESLNTAYDKRFCSLNPDSSHGICNMNYRQPKLVVTYTLPAQVTPSVPTLVAAKPWENPDNNGMATSLDPTWSAASVDPDGSNVSVRFEAYSSSAPSSSSSLGSCSTPTVPSSTVATCKMSSRLPAGVFYVRARASDGSNVSGWSTVAAKTASARLMAYEVAEQVFAAADRDVAVAALSTFDRASLYEFGLLSDPGSVPGTVEVSPDVAARALWADVDPDEIAVDTTTYVAQLESSGSDAEIEDVKASVPELIEADASLGQLTSSQVNDISQTLSASAAAARLDELSEVWAPENLDEEAEAWETGLEMSLNDPQYQSYVDNQLVVSKWVGVQVDGNSATAILDGNQELVLATGTVQGSLDEQFQIDLVRQSSSAPWKLVTVDQVAEESDVAVMGTGVPTRASSSSAFSRDSAIAYAKKYSCNLINRPNHEETEGKCANKTKYGYVSGGDCTNFMSQALYTAGMDERGLETVLTRNDNTLWWHGGSLASKSWGYVDNFKKFMVDKSKRGTLKQITSVKSAYSGVAKGDIYLVDLHGSGIGHAMMSLGSGNYPNFYDYDSKKNYRDFGADGSKIAQHSTDRVDAPWNWAYRVFTPSQRAKLKYYVLHFDGTSDY